MTSEPLAHRVDGDGEPLLLLNGIAMTMASWEPVVARLAGHRILRCDLRGQLLSPGPPPERLQDHAADVAALAENLGMTPLTVLATSFGAAVAVVLAAARPELIRSLVLVAAVDRATPAMEAEIVRWREGCLEALQRGDGSILADTIEPAVYSRRWLETNRNQVAVRRAALASLPPVFFENMAALLDTAGGLDVAEAAPRVSCPALVAAAESDRFMSFERTRALADLLPEGRLTVLPGLGHAAVIEDPAAVAALVNR